MLYIFWFLHQTTTQLYHSFVKMGCISFDSNIKPQLLSNNKKLKTVVYLLIPTSNHNLAKFSLSLIRLYIFWFLHQTTTRRYLFQVLRRCISFDSYIKPQPFKESVIHISSCISFDSYIKPQLFNRILLKLLSCISFDSYIKPQPTLTATIYSSVVYLLIPTSNHNSLMESYAALELYIFWFLHQTTTSLEVLCAPWRLYIFWFLHQTTTFLTLTYDDDKLYIFWFLHQTTTMLHIITIRCRCISFDSYIKPQQARFELL